MIPEAVKKEILPELAAPGENVPKVALPCGVDLKFARDGETITWKEFRSWHASLREAGEIAGNNAISYIQWVEIEEGVFVNDDSGWPALALAPATFIEHNHVPGHPVLYVVSKSQAILTGSKCPAGLERIRKAIDRGGLAASAMALNYDRKTWSRFYVHDATAFDLPGMTITDHATGEGKYKRQTSPPSHYGHVQLEIAPYIGGHDFLLVWAVTEETIPSEFREAIREGIQDVALDSAAETGPTAGIQVTVTGGSFHQVDSRAASFRIAAALAFRNALQNVTRVPQAERRREQSRTAT